MKITQEVRDYAAKKGISEVAALKEGMEERSVEFVKTVPKSITSNNVMSIEIKLNGETRQVDDGCTLQDLISSLATAKPCFGSCGQP